MIVELPPIGSVRSVGDDGLVGGVHGRGPPQDPLSKHAAISYAASQHTRLQHVLLQHMMEHVDSQTRPPTLKELREKAGKTALDVAQDVGVMRDRTVYAWERGEQLPDHSKVLSLARSLGCSIRQIYESLGFDTTGIPLDAAETQNA